MLYKKGIAKIEKVETIEYLFCPFCNNKIFIFPSKLNKNEQCDIQCNKCKKKFIINRSDIYVEKDSH